MVENVGRKLVFIAILMVASVLLLTVPWFAYHRSPIPLGLDIAGGTRLVYSLDFKAAREQHLIGANETEAEVQQTEINILRNRLDAVGEHEATIRGAGIGRIEISLPSGKEHTRTVAPQKLAEAIDTSNAAIKLVGTNATLSDFPAGGGTIGIDNEHIKYKARVENELRDITRGDEGGSEATPHAAGATVILVNDDAVKNSIENLGDMQFYPVAEEKDFRAGGADETKARADLNAWLANPDHVNASVTQYNALHGQAGGPPNGILWFPSRLPAGVAVPPLAQRQFEALAVPKPEWQFTGGDLARVYPSNDESGLPAVGFEMSASARDRFGAFTTAYVKKRMAIVLNNEVITAPTIESPLIGSAIIRGQYTQLEVEQMVTVLRSGSLKIKPKLEEAETVGASIGDDYVRRNLYAGLVTMGVISLFMVWYYGALGVNAVICLLCNLTMLFAAMVVTQSTLTLAGIGGIVLTIGMAVDANILIFDRMREEQEKGRKPLQAAKEGFAGANAAIIDGHVTTLITGIILQWIGTGTIKGFAVTLNVGILTSLFSVLFIGRVLVHLQLRRGVERWHMKRWLADAKFKFLAKAPIMLPLAGLVIVAGIVGFLMEDDTRKLGIDFLGGATVKVRTENALHVDDVRTRVTQLPGELKTAEVVDLPSSRDESGKATEFRITFKTNPESTQAPGAEREFANQVRRGLADILQSDAVVLDLKTEDAATKAEGVLHFEKSHPADDVKKVLAEIGFVDPQPLPGPRPSVVKFTATAPAGAETGILHTQIERAFTGKSDSSGREYKLIGPIGESTVIGAQVVGELRDSAIKALVLSAILMLLYIRVRFAEYSYGIGALLADLHDVLTTLSAVAMLILVPFIHVEMNLTMIAAFLTILGYSISDTIIVYDRIRENRTRVKGTLREVIDLSINQTLSRTILTSSTVIFAALVLLFFNFGTGNPLEGFSFALAWGVVTGTFSSIYIASPLMLWIDERAERKAKRDGGGGPPAPAGKAAQSAAP